MTSKLRACSVVATSVATLLLTACAGSDGDRGSTANQTTTTTTTTSPRRVADLEAPKRVDGADVVVDLTQPAPGQPTMVGFLNSVSGDGPPDALIAPLHPSVLRGTSDRLPFERTARLGARYSYLMSVYGGPPTWGGQPKPYDDLAHYDRWVRQRLEELIAEGAPDDLIVEAWNEPDWPDFWDGTKEQFFEVYAVTEAAVRDVMPHAKVLGPNIATYDPDYIRAFLDFCLERGCTVDILAYHEMQQDYLDQETDPLVLAERTRKIRAEFIDNPKYAPLGISELMVNESGSPGEDAQPGGWMSIFSAYEAAGIDALVHACWHDTCFVDRIDNLLDDHGRRRTTWWAVAAYANGLAGRVASASFTDNLFPIANAPTDDAPAQVIVARRNAEDSVSADIRIALSGLDEIGTLDADGTITVTATYLLGDKVAEQEPAPTSTQTITATGTAGHRSATVTVPAPPPGAALVLAIRPA